MEQIQDNLKKLSFPLAIIVSALVLSFTSLHSYLLFHTSLELFTVVIAFGVFVVAWTSRHYVGNNFLLVFGVGYLFIGSLDFLHALSYAGIEVIKGGGATANLPTQLWVAARFLEAFSFMAALLFLKNKYKKNYKANESFAYLVLLAYAGFFLLLILFIFYWENFPVAYVDGTGLTAFKKISEYVIASIFLVGIILLFKKSRLLDREMGGLLALSFIVKIGSEISFTEYLGVYDFSNMFGHLLKFISFLLLYKAVLELGLMKPYAILFADLKKSEELYRSLVDFSPDAIVVHAKGKILYANEPAKKLVGAKDKAEIIGADISNFFQPYYRKIVKGRIEKVEKGVYEQTPLIEAQILRTDGTLVDVEMKGEKISYEGRMAMESIIRDISNRKRVEAELAKTQHELKKKIEEQLSESYIYLGLVNRKIAMLLELEDHSLEKKNKQEIVDYISNSAVSLSRAKTGLLYTSKDHNKFDLISSCGLGRVKADDFKRLTGKEVNFIAELVKEKKRLNGPCALVDRNCFGDSFDFSYFVALPILSRNRCAGFIFLGFEKIKSMDADELQFLDVFSKHVSIALGNAGILE